MRTQAQGVNADREARIVEGNASVHQAVIAHHLTDEKDAIQEWRSTEAPLTEDQITGYENKEYNDVTGEWERGAPIYKRVQSPLASFGALDPDDPFSPVVQRDAKGEVVTSTEHFPPGIFASDMSLNPAGGLSTNIRNAQNEFKRRIVENVTSDRKDSRGQKDALAFLDKYLDIVEEGRTPRFSRDIKSGIYALGSQGDKFTSGSGSAKDQEKLISQRGRKLKFAQDLMFKLEAEKGMEIPDDLWGKFNHINEMAQLGKSGTYTGYEDENRRNLVRNIISNHAIKSHPEYGGVYRDLSDELLAYYSEEGAEHNGHRYNWTDSKQDNFEDWANNWLDTKHEELQAVGIQGSTQTYKPAGERPPLPEKIDLQQSATQLLRNIGQDQAEEGTSKTPSDEPAIPYGTQLEQREIYFKPTSPDELAAARKAQAAEYISRPKPTDVKANKGDVDG
jgi:hypothetical protein